MEKENELESHFLITVPGEWKTEFPLWSNGPFGIFNETKSGAFPASGGCFRGFTTTCPWLGKEICTNVPELPHYQLLPFSSQKELCRLSDVAEKARGT